MGQSGELECQVISDVNNSIYSRPDLRTQIANIGLLSLINQVSRARGWCIQEMEIKNLELDLDGLCA